MRATPDRLRRTVGGILAALLLAPLPCLADDWPQFRGPNRDGVSGERGVVKRWLSGGVKQRFRVPLGSGFSGVSVVGERLYTLLGNGDGEFAVCLDAGSGSEVWRVRLDDLWKDRQGDGPRATPTVHDGIVYALSANAKLFALGAADGRTIWSHDLRAAFGARVPRWGMSTSPLVEGDLLLVEAGGPAALLVALDRKSGEVRWEALDGKPGYSSPLALELAGRRQVLLFSGRALHGVDPAGGRALWSLPWKTSWDVNAAMPVKVGPDKVFISSGYDKGSALLKLVGGDDPRVQELWRSREMKNKFSTSVPHEGHLYGFDNAILVCLDVRNGEARWKARDFGFGSLIRVDGHLIVLGDAAQLALVEATPEGFVQKARTRLDLGKTWTLPTLAAGRLYVRDERSLLALDIGD
jgi:outer membrane protein assembly factor BamB